MKLIIGDVDVLAEKRPCSAQEPSGHSSPLVAPENALEGLKQALLSLCDAVEGNPLYDGGKGITPERIRRMVSKY